MLQPSFLPGLNVSLDYFDITVKGFLGGYGADNIIDRCVQQQDAAFCALVRRDANGSLWLSPQGYVEDTTFNTGKLVTTGVDVNLGYRTDLDSLGMEGMGTLSANFVGTWLDTLKFATLPGDPLTDCAGKYGTVCSATAGLTSPNPEWRHKARLTWATPLEYGDWFKDFSVSVQWRHFSSVDLDDPTGPASDLKLASRDYFDLTASWTVRDNLNFRAGVNNVFDMDPPLTGSSNCPTGPCNGNTWPQVYDAFGRYLFVGLTADF